MALTKEKDSNPYSWNKARRMAYRGTPDAFKRMGGEQKRFLRYFLDCGGVEPCRLQVRAMTEALFKSKEEIKLWSCRNDPKGMAAIGRSWVINRLNSLIKRGLIRREREGRNSFYCMPKEVAKAVREYLIKDVHKM